MNSETRFDRTYPFANIDIPRWSKPNIEIDAPSMVGADRAAGPCYFVHVAHHKTGIKLGPNLCMENRQNKFFMMKVGGHSVFDQDSSHWSRSTPKHAWHFCFDRVNRFWLALTFVHGTSVQPMTIERLCRTELHLCLGFKSSAPRRFDNFSVAEHNLDVESSVWESDPPSVSHLTLTPIFYLVFNGTHSTPFQR